MIAAELIDAIRNADDGSTVTTGPVVFAERVNINKALLAGVTLDATGAHFLEGLGVANSTGLTVRGGTYGTREKDTAQTYAIHASSVTDFSIVGATLLAGPGGNCGGVQVRNGTRVTVRDSLFVGHRTGLSLYECADALAARNKFREATSDGINVVGCHGFVVADNDCFWEKRVGNAHPDGIQLWSIKDKPPQSDGWILNNKIVGMMQGILSSDPKVEPGSGTRLRFHGNYCAVVFSHTITGGLLTDSVATDNVLASYPGSLFGIGKLKGFETSRGNFAARNVMRDGTKELPPRIWWLGEVPIQPGSKYDDHTFMPQTLETAP